MNRPQFFAQLPRDLSDSELDYIKNAYWMSKASHKGQVRDTGERYFEHPRRVALYLIKTCKERAYLVSEIVMALLHDIEEDTFPPEGLLERLFGPNVYRGLHILSKMKLTFDKRNGDISKAKKDTEEYYRKIKNDPWSSVRRVKVCDRLDNISSMGIWPAERRKKYLDETRKYIMPIAKKTDLKLAKMLESELRKAGRAIK